MNYVFDGDYSITETEEYSNVTLYNDKGKAVKNILRRKEASGYTKIGTSETNYAAEGYLSSQTDMSGIVTSYAYNAYRQPTQTIVQKGIKMKSEKTYDADIVVSETDESGKSVAYTRTNEHITNVTDGNIVSGYVYNSQGLVSQIHGNGSVYGVNTFTYNSGLPVKYSSGGAYYNFTYDGFGRVTEVKENGNVVKSAEYSEGTDIDGVSGATDKIKVTFANGFKVESYTDKYGNTLEVRENGSSTEKTTFTYNSSDHILNSVLDNIGKLSYNYVYSQGKLYYAEVSSSEESALNYRKTPSYDDYGEENGVNYFYGGSNHVYSVAKNQVTNAVTSLTTPLFNYSYEYDNLGRLTRKTIPFAGYTKYTTYQYADNAAYEGYTTPRVSVYDTGFGYSWRYSYDANGNIVKITDGDKNRTTYEYDGAGRLTRENVYGYNTYTYAYDSRGNLLSKTTYAYTTGSLGAQISKIENEYDARNRMIKHGGVTVTYDANGNQTSFRNSTTLTWTRGRLLDNYYGMYLYKYNSDGIRISKTYRYTNKTTRYMLDGERIIAEYDGTSYKKFFYDESGIAGMIYNGNKYYFFKNLQGDVVGVCNQGGSLVGTYDYDAWGNILNSVTNDVLKANPFRYRGYYYDTETGLYYLNSRYYDPEIGRFISPDGISYIDPETLGGLNLYAYCNNNPVMYIDYYGNFSISFGDISITGEYCSAVPLALMAGLAKNARRNAIYNSINRLSSTFGKVSTVNGLAATVLDAGISIYNGIKNGQSVSRVLSDALVDIGISLLTTIAVWTFTSSIVPVFGNLIGFTVGLGIALFDEIFPQIRQEIKDVIYGFGCTIISDICLFMVKCIAFFDRTDNYIDSWIKSEIYKI